MPPDLVELLFSKLFKQIHVYFKETSCGFFFAAEHGMCNIAAITYGEFVNWKRSE